MQVVCETTQSPDTQVRVAALQCLVKIMTLYYQHMEHYMGPALFAVSSLPLPSYLLACSTIILRRLGDCLTWDLHLLARYGS